MELLDGADLHELSPIPYREACRYLRDVASSLALLHARRLLHRDLSPRNHETVVTEFLRREEGLSLRAQHALHMLGQYAGGEAYLYDR